MFFDVRFEKFVTAVLVVSVRFDRRGRQRLRLRQPDGADEFGVRVVRRQVAFAERALLVRRAHVGKRRVLGRGLLQAVRVVVVLDE